MGPSGKHEPRPATVARVFRLGDFVVDPALLQIQGTERKTRVEFKVMQVLLALVDANGAVVSRKALEAAVWSGRFVSEDATTNAIGKLRKAFGDRARSPEFIETVPKVGYRLLKQPVFPGPLQMARNSAQRSLRAWTVSGLLALMLAAVVVLVAMLDREPETDRTVMPQRPTIAVLPFESEPDDPRERRLAVGVGSDLIADLSRQPGLAVYSAKSTAALGASSEGIVEALRKMGADYFVMGGLAQRQDEIKISIRLLETMTGFTVYSRTLRFNEQTLFEKQVELAAGIASAVAERTGSDLRFVASHGATRSLSAYDQFLLGITHFRRMTPEDNALARTHFIKATELDPGFARAFAGVALTWVREVMDGWTADPARAVAEASRNVERAESIDPRVPQIYFVKGMAALFEGKHKEAAEAAQHATTLDPNYADAYALLSWILHYGGRSDVALVTLRQALRLNPSSSSSYEQIAGEIHFASGDYTSAERCFAEALERNPWHSRARLWMAATKSMLGRFDDAQWELDQLLFIDGELPGTVEHAAIGYPHKDEAVTRKFMQALDRISLFN